MSDPFNRKPWPMKWVALAILLMIVPYTILTIKYRKPEPAYQPYEDSKQRANVLRLLDAGFQRLTVTAERPADPQENIRQIKDPVPTNVVAGGLPNGLDTTLVEIPELPASINAVTAARETAALLPYPVLFTCALSDQKHQLAGAQVFIRGKTVVIVPSFEPLSGELTARSKESVVQITLPGGTLKAGDCTVHLVGSTQSRQWPLVIK